MLVLFDTFRFFALLLVLSALFLLVCTFQSEDVSLVLVLFDTFCFFAVLLVLFNIFLHIGTFQREDVSLVLVPAVTPSQVQMPGHKGPPTYPTHVSDADIKQW